MSGLWEEAAVPERTHAGHHTPPVPQLIASICGFFFCLFFPQIYDSELRLRHDNFTRTKCEVFWEDNESGDGSSQWEGRVEQIGVGL